MLMKNMEANMVFLVVGAMDSEVEFFKESFNCIDKKQTQGFEFCICEYNNHQVIVTKSGIGRTMAGLLIGVAMSNFAIDKVINIGIAGGYPPVMLKDVIVCDKCVYGDVDVTFFENYEYGQMAQCPKIFPSDNDMLEKIKNEDVLIGTICTCDSFTSESSVANNIIRKLNNVEDVLCFDMESCAFAQACFYVGVPFLAIRSVSDIITDENQKEEYEINDEKPEMKANELVKKIINSYCK